MFKMADTLSAAMDEIIKHAAPSVNARHSYFTFPNYGLCALRPPGEKEASAAAGRSPHSALQRGLPSLFWAAPVSGLFVLFCSVPAVPAAANRYAVQGIKETRRVGAGKGIRHTGVEQLAAVPPIGLAVPKRLVL